MKLLYLLILTLLPFWGIAQIESPEKLVNYDSITYKLYVEEKWDSLMLISKKAVSQNSDNFYILVRVGAAAFYKGNYSYAAALLEKAIRLNQVNSYANELLYYSYLYTGRKSFARLITRSMDSSLAFNIKRNFHAPAVYMEAGPVISDNKPGIIENLANDSLLFLESYTEKQALYLTCGAVGNIFDRVSLNIAYSNLSITKTREVLIKDIDSLKGDYTVRQSEFYLSPAFVINKRLMISPSARYVITNISEPFTSDNDITKLYIGDPIAEKINSWVAGVEILYARNYWKASMGAWNMNLGNSNSFQVSSTFMIMPFGNLDFYAITSLTYKSDREKTPVLPTQLLGFKAYKRTWIELSVTPGNIAETVENNAQLLNNHLNSTKLRLASMVLYDATQKLRLFARYQITQSEATTYKLYPVTGLNTENYNYTNHIVTGGFLWKL